MTFSVLTVYGDCVLDLCLEQDTDDHSGCSNTKEFFSLLIGG